MQNGGKLTHYFLARSDRSTSYFCTVFKPSLSSVYPYQFACLNLSHFWENRILKSPFAVPCAFLQKVWRENAEVKERNSNFLQFQIDSGQEKGLICGWSKVQRIWRVRTWCKTMKEFDSNCACKHAYLSNLEVTCLKWIYFSKFRLLKQTKSVLVVPNRCLILWLKMKEIYFWREISLVGSYADCLLSNQKSIISLYISYEERSQYFDI